MIQQRVVEAFEEEKARAKLPGYVPSYDDFDVEDAGMAMGTGRPGSEPAQVRQGERPRGPHRTPSRPSRASDRPANGFGAGIL